MFSRSQRLSKQEVTKLLKIGRPRASQFIVVKEKQSPHSKSRFAVVVGSSVSRKATERNSMRRKITSIVKELSLGLPDSRDAVVIALPGIRGKSFSEIRRVLKSLF